MAHELTIRADGTAEMFSLRESPWHKLGRILPDEITDDKVLEMAGLDWQVNAEPVFLANTAKLAGGDSITNHDIIPGYKVLRRSDLGNPLAVVSDQYRVFQNRELVDLLRRIAKETHVVWETAGSLRNGRDVWVLGRLPELSWDVRGDASNAYMLATNGHGNNRSLQIMPTSVRVVCANTMRMAEGSEYSGKARRKNARTRNTSALALSQGYAIHHNHGLDRAVEEVVSAYANMVGQRDATKAAAEQMADRPFSREDSVAYWDAVMRWSERRAKAQETSERLGTKVATGLVEASIAKEERCLRDFNESQTNQLPGTVGTLWSAMQTVVEYADHGGSESHFWSAQFGGRAKIKTDAWDKALELVNA